MASNDDSATPTHCCISHEFSRAASQSPNRIAVIHASGGRRTRTSITDDAAASVQTLYEGDRSFTYADLISAVDSLTSQLPHNSELRPRIIGLYMPPSVEYIVSVVSVLRCGQAFLPLDPSWPKQRLLSVIASANVDLIITCTTPFGYELDSNWLEKNSNRSFLWFSMGGESVSVSDGGALGLGCNCHSEKERLFCYVMYTSGSTGKPKGVCGTEQGLLNRFLWMQELYPLNGEGFLLFKTAISFIDHLQEFLSAILTGSTLVIPPFNHVKQNVFYLLDFLQVHGPSFMFLLPFELRL